MLGLATKGLRDFEETKNEIIEYFYFVNLDFLNIQIFHYGFYYFYTKINFSLIDNLF